MNARKRVVVLTRPGSARERTGAAIAEAGADVVAVLDPAVATEAEVRDILEQAAKPEGRIRLGSLLAEIGREARLSDKERAVFESAITRDKTPAEPISFD